MSLNSNSMYNEPRVFLAILNITSFTGQCADAQHLYGNLILSIRDDVNINNVTDWNIKYLGKNIEIKQPLTLELAKQLDEIDGNNSNQRALRYAEQDGEIAMTSRFNTFDEVVNAGIQKWKELDIDCPFISLYEGERYTANQVLQSSTIILEYNK